MALLKALLAGAAGAIALTTLHESARRVIPHAPRVDAIGKRAIGKSLQRFGIRPHSGARLYRLALTGDLVSNTLYYTCAALGPAKGRLTRAAALGILGGAGAVALPPLLGLGKQPNQYRPVTFPLTIAWYLTGALVAAGVVQLLDRDSPEQNAASSAN